MEINLRLEVWWLELTEILNLIRASNICFSIIINM